MNDEEVIEYLEKLAKFKNYHCDYNALRYGIKEELAIQKVIYCIKSRQELKKEWEVCKKSKDYNSNSDRAKIEAILMEEG